MEMNIKKLSLLVLVSTVFLSACGDEKSVQEKNSKAEVTSMTTEVATTEKEAEPENTGESLVKANCVRCHGDEVYTRADRKVTSLEGLGKQVRMCDTQLDTRLFPEDLDLIINYLNETYYKF